MMPALCFNAGALSSVTQLATSVSRNLDRLSLDPEHLAWKESLRTGPSAGIGQGLSTLGISLLGIASTLLLCFLPTFVFTRLSPLSSSRSVQNALEVSAISWKDIDSKVKEVCLIRLCAHRKWCCAFLIVCKHQQLLWNAQQVDHLYVECLYNTRLYNEITCNEGIILSWLCCELCSVRPLQ